MHKRETEDTTPIKALGVAFTGPGRRCSCGSRSLRCLAPWLLRSRRTQTLPALPPISLPARSVGGLNIIKSTRGVKFEKNNTAQAQSMLHRCQYPKSDQAFNYTPVHPKRNPQLLFCTSAGFSVLQTSGHGTACTVKTPPWPSEEMKKVSRLTTPLGAPPLRQVASS